MTHLDEQLFFERGFAGVLGVNPQNHARQGNPFASHLTNPRDQAENDSGQGFFGDAVIILGL